MQRKFNKFYMTLKKTSNGYILELETKKQNFEYIGGRESILKEVEYIININTLKVLIELFDKIERL